MSGNIVELTDDNFDELINGSDKLVIVEFYTQTCPNGKVMEPVFGQVAKELEDIAIFAKINAQQNPRQPANHGVMGVPSYKFFCNGRTIGENVGAMPATILRNTIKDYVKRKRECLTKSTPISYEMDGYS